MGKSSRRRTSRQAADAGRVAAVARRPDRASLDAAGQATAQAARLHAEGQYQAALNAYYAALTLAPDHAPALHGLGVVCFQLGRADDAIVLVRRAVQVDPTVAEYHNNLGTLLAARRQLEEAIVCHHRALQLAPTFAEAHNNLGNALRQFGRYDEALLCFERALTHRPGYAEAALNRGNVFGDRHDYASALAAYEQAVRLDPGLADAHNAMGTALKRLGRFDDALAAYRHALALAPDAAIVHYNLGTALYEAGQPEAAGEALAAALARQPEFPEALLNVGNLAKDQGRLEDALAYYQKALALRPDYRGAHGNLLFALNYVDGMSQQAIFDAHRDFERRHAAALTTAWRPHANIPDPSRRLRIGYVSPDLRAHAVAFFLEPLLAHHDHAAVEVFAYAEVAYPDGVTTRLRALCDHWRSTVGLRDDEVAELIRADGIDIVIDLAGHTANNRLLALARKPAPLQVSYLGYPATTGLAAMDYRLTDTVTEPEGTSEHFYTERLLRLPDSLWCFRPFPDMPAVTALPALTNGYVTFGSFNNFAKVGPRVIALWADVLNALPSARLSLLCAADAATQARVRADFAAHGVAPERLILHGREPRSAYLQRFATVDIALDPFPCNGGTTTCDALWMGLPVIALVGDTFLSRASYSVLTAAGLDEFARLSPADYVSYCVQLARNVSRLATWRATLRDRLRASPLLDGAGFARHFETALRGIWQTWCAGSAQDANDGTPA
ncbi:MAG: tetratricopeptide repeat protein [Gammaproteobacteria bacterium]